MAYVTIIARLQKRYSRVQAAYHYAASQLATIYRIGSSSPDIDALVAHKEALGTQLTAIADKLARAYSTYKVTTDQGKRLVIRSTLTHTTRLAEYIPSKRSTIPATDRDGTVFIDKSRPESETHQ